MKLMFAVVILAFVAYTNANAIGQVLDVAKPGSPVGSHGPALVNVGGHGGWGNGGWGNGGWGNGGWGNGGWGNGGWNNGGWNNGGWNNGGWGNDGWNNGGHGLPSLQVNGWGAQGDAHGHDGKYVAKNRGAVHVAPLVGHIQSVKSTNAEPAPGTTW